MESSKKELKLLMVLLGCKPNGRTTEQHDVFFGIGTGLADLADQMNAFWPDSGGLHIDAWREVTCVDGYKITVVPKTKNTEPNSENKKLFFINLGGYKKDDFEEYHYKILSVSKDLGSATKNSKNSVFYKHTGFKGPGAATHLDDKYGIDVDDVYAVEDILPDSVKKRYSLSLMEDRKKKEDELYIGYIRFSKIK